MLDILTMEPVRVTSLPMELAFMSRTCVRESGMLCNLTCTLPACFRKAPASLLLALPG